MAPTRELAVQIFQVLQKIGKYHSTLAVGLLIGGKHDFFEEQQRLGQTNLVIATPGRLLQHCEQTPYVDWSLLKILVLDEADRILDLGFRDQLVRVLDYLPVERQTLLFSATQTRDVKQLATLSLEKPEYLGVHDLDATSTPASLQQSYVVVPLKDKLNALFSFLKSHLQHKTIFFFSSCAQVRHAYDLLCTLRPGVPILALHGKLSQTRRTSVYMDFLRKPHVALLATDVCARGLDFPNVDWVIQVDAPEDRDMYIHRAGRTARYRAGGKALLFLTPQEDQGGYIEKVLQAGNKQAKEIPIRKASINPNKTVVLGQRAASLVVQDVAFHLIAKKAFCSYVRSLQLMPNHPEIFRIKDQEILDAYANALGLASTPKVRGVEDRDGLRAKKNVNRKLQKLKEQIKAEKLAKKVAQLGQKGSNVLQEIDNGDEGDDLLVSKEAQSWKGDEEDLPDAKVNEVTQRRPTKKIRVEGSNSTENRHIKFDDEDDAVDEEEKKEAAEDLAAATDAYAEKVRERLRRNQDEDEKEAKERIREKHQKKRWRDKNERDSEADNGAAAVLGGTDHSDEMSETDTDDKEDSTSSNGSSSDDDSVDLQAQEAQALALIRGK